MNFPTKNDEAIVAQELRLGNRNAHGFILDQYTPAIYFFSTRLTGSTSIAEVVVEEVMHRVWEKRTTFNSLTAIRIFLYATARECCFEYVKQLQPSIRDGLEWLHLWQHTEEYVQREIIRAEVLRCAVSHPDQIPMIQHINTPPTTKPTED